MKKKENLPTHRKVGFQKCQKPRIKILFREKRNVKVLSRADSQIAAFGICRDDDNETRVFFVFHGKVVIAVGDDFSRYEGRKRVIVGIIEVLSFCKSGEDLVLPCYNGIPLR